MPPGGRPAVAGVPTTNSSLRAIQSAVMTQPTETTEEALLRHAERQTKALESINGSVLFLLVLAILGAILGLVAITH